MPDQLPHGKGRDLLLQARLGPFRNRILNWYRRHGRSFLWRRTRDPYRIWVSEVMLQQTQVTTVTPYYKNFLKTFPRVEGLARAPLQKVLKHWEGLGYYSRARNLHKAARAIVRQWDGKIPPDPGDLQKLPGIGPSTAGAIASLSFGVRAAILDGNLKRLFSRLQAIETPIRGPKIQKKLWQFSEAILPHSRCGDFNQALMDLGATVCMPKRPSCRLCPVSEFCEAFRRGIQDRLPITPRAAPLPHRSTLSAVIFRQNHMLVIRRSEKGLLGGLWGLPEIPTANAGARPQAAEHSLRRQWGIRAGWRQALKPVPHAFTHLRMTYHPVVFDYMGGQPSNKIRWRWIDRSRIPQLPFSAATHRIFEQLPRFAAAPSKKRARSSGSEPEYGATLPHSV